MATRTILLVDDDRELRKLVADFLSGHDFCVQQASGAGEMRAALQTTRFDLIILDVMMPEEDGLSALRKLDPASRPAVILLSAMGSEVDRIVGLEIGADDYVVKPCNPRELLARVRAVLRRTDGGAIRPARVAIWRVADEPCHL